MGDRHVLMIDKDTCRVYELFKASPSPRSTAAGSASAGPLCQAQSLT